MAEAILTETFTGLKLTVQNQYELDVLLALIGTVTEKELMDAIEECYHVRKSYSIKHLDAWTNIQDVLCDPKEIHKEKKVYNYGRVT